MWSNYANERGRCVVSLDALGEKNAWWGYVPNEECKKFPKHYSVGIASECFYCPGTFDPLTGICSTAECPRKNGRAYGLSESDCAACNGSFQFRYMLNGKVGECKFQ